jgi:hypothetical protein
MTHCIMTKYPTHFVFGPPGKWQRDARQAALMENVSNWRHTRSWLGLASFYVLAQSGGSEST